MKRELTPFQQSAMNYASNILLTANAGSGKTFVLAKRFVEILLNENTDIGNIVAITFTDKAAGELNKRIALEMDSRIELESNKDLHRKLENARRQLVSANISTIHSFCINILKEFAPEAGIDVNFMPIDQMESDELIDLSIEESISHLIGDADKSEDLKNLIRFFGSRTILINHLKTAIHQRKIIDQHLSQLYQKPDSDIINHFDELTRSYFDLLFRDKVERSIKFIRDINDFVLRYPKGSEIAGNIAGQLKKLEKNSEKLFTGLKEIDNELFTQKGEVKNRGYLSKGRDDFEEQIKFVQETFDDLRPLIEIEHPEAALKSMAEFGKNFFKIFEYVLNVYSLKKKQRGCLDFEDILLFTQEILKLDEVKEYLQKKFDYIMVDEYQDTNEIQYNIIMPVLNNLKHGNLFVVGDEKQSIYMFRDADLKVFNQTKDDIVRSESGGKLLNLPHSFRMAPQLILFTNKLFGKIFENPNPLLNEVEYNNLICAKSESEKSSVEFLLSDNEKGISEASLVAEKILELVSEGKAEFNEIGILCRKRSLFKELEDEFVIKKIPYFIIGGKGFYQRQTIYDIYNYLSFILNKDDDTALIGILRAPFYNLSDKELFKLSFENGSTYYQKLKNNSATNPKLAEVFNQLERHCYLGLNSEIYSLIRTILNDTYYWAVVAAERNSVQEIANIEKLLAMARNFSRKSFKNLYDFTVLLREMIETMEDEGQAQVSTDDNSVKLLTIHQSKGLEFKAVFIYGSNNFGRDNSVKTRGMSIDKDFGFLTKVPVNKNFFEDYSSTPATAIYNYVNHKKSIAEIKRLFYVAVTRAEKYLFISAAHKKYAVQKDSFFEMLCSGLSLDFSKNKINLSGKVNFMSGAEENYRIEEKEVSVDIEIKHDLKGTDEIVVQKELMKPDYKYLVGTIGDVPKKEIISATKISMYTQCPVKYELTYDLGYSTIFNYFKEGEADAEFNNLEDEENKVRADLKGRVIHKILKENFDEKDLPDAIDQIISNDSVVDAKQKSELTSSILHDLKLFYSSKAFAEIKTKTNYKNELEVYCEEGEHYLFGIIDKLVFENGELVIVDYKTDNIKIEQIESRAQDYFSQLKFYAYILSKLYPDYNNYSLRIIFIKHPDQLIEMKINRDELKAHGIQINAAITKIISRKFTPNFNNCPKCQFALEGNKCVKNYSL